MRVGNRKPAAPVTAGPSQSQSSGPKGVTIALVLPECLHPGGRESAHRTSATGSSSDDRLLPATAQIVDNPKGSHEVAATAGRHQTQANSGGPVVDQRGVGRGEANA